MSRDPAESGEAVGPKGLPSAFAQDEPKNVFEGQDLAELKRVAEQLAEPDKGIRYRNGAVSGSFVTELEAYGPTARNLFWLTQNAATVLSLLHRLETAERERDEALMIAEGPSTLKELAAMAFERGVLASSSERKAKAWREAANRCQDEITHLQAQLARAHEALGLLIAAFNEVYGESDHAVTHAQVRSYREAVGRASEVFTSLSEKGES